MKGIIFTAFVDMVEENFGLDTLNTLLEKVQPPSGGAYTAGLSYPFEELVLLITTFSTMINIPTNELIETFGIYLFPVLAASYSSSMEQLSSYKNFLKTIDHVIHVEVKKLNPEATLPTINYEDESPNKLVMLYNSPRKLCPLAIGLIKGGAPYFKVEVGIAETACMHKGSDHCRLEIAINE